MKAKLLIFVAISALLILQTCKTKEKVTHTNEKVMVNNKTATNDTIPNKNNKIVITEKNIADTNKVKKTKSNVEKSITVGNEKQDTIIVNVDVSNFETRLPDGHPITTPLPQIFTDLFPDVKWELVIDNDGELRYYRTSNLKKQYAPSIVNDFVYSQYKPGEITDKQLIEFFIFWFFHPDDSNMKIISTDFLEIKAEGYFNYKSEIIFNNKELKCFSLVKDHKIYGIKTYKNGKLDTQKVIIY